MAECIEREAAVAIIEEKQRELCPVGMYSRHAVYGSDREKFDAWEEIIEALEAIPSADVQPVRHGRWDISRTDYGWNCSEFPTHCKCSLCGREIPYQDQDNYCHNCGAKMDQSE